MAAVAKATAQRTRSSVRGRCLCSTQGQRKAIAQAKAGLPGRGRIRTEVKQCGGQLYGRRLRVAVHGPNTFILGVVSRERQEI